ncbi:hypothetical protein LPB86_20110 [Pedobacter sp. MC2016-14]|uniref:hypothetical protein n=1 Tax=Pedobacter sp. MC2016-14 TaxID=2897327 RepID=UPI001E4C551C|nr:hypothetical protein [Pedobacter sp. MC2016-14]MCD0490555.1 hypothetical protein [Pedobacter sp. MC2016-14]
MDKSFYPADCIGMEYLPEFFSYTETGVGVKFWLRQDIFFNPLARATALQRKA